MNPYDSLPPNAFWRSAVAQKNMFDVDGLWIPKFNILKSDKIVTFGSCFAQHIGRALGSRGFNWMSYEAPPNDLAEEDWKHFNYNVFSARTGNIYTTSLLKQWVEWALGRVDLPDEIWSKNDLYIDPFRPNIQPNGFNSIEDLVTSRAKAVASFGRCIKEAQYFIYTLGLTESWINNQSGYEYPTCPGVIGGEFDSQLHTFKNQRVDQVLSSLSSAMEMMRAVNPKLKFVLTVSPVPLTATNSGRHVLVATMASKSILRSVADQLSTNRNYVDYFPSYEIINSPTFRGSFFEPNQRNVNAVGVDFVMKQFFSPLDVIKSVLNNSHKDDFDPTCEEALLDEFSVDNRILTDASKLAIVGNSHIVGFKQKAILYPFFKSATFIPTNWLLKTIHQVALQNNLTEFLFQDQYKKNVGDIKVINPETLILVGVGLAGDAIIRAHGPLQNVFEGCNGKEITPSLPLLKEFNNDLVGFYRHSIRNQLKLVFMIEKAATYCKIIWIVSPDMSRHDAEFRLGVDFVNSGAYKIHKKAYLAALSEESIGLSKTIFVLHSEEKCCFESGFTLNKYKTNMPDGDIHCNPDFYSDTVLEVLEHLKVPV